MNRASALSSIRASAISGVISFALTTTVAIIAATSGAFDMAGTQVSAYMFLDSVLIAVFTIGMFLKWRWCAIAMGLYFVVSKYDSFQTGFNVYGYVTGIIFIYFYLDGLRGAIFLYREDLKLASQINFTPPDPTAAAAPVPSAPVPATQTPVTPRQ